MYHSLSVVLVAFRDAVVVDAVDSVVFDTDVVAVVPVFDTVPSSDVVGSAVVVFVGSPLAARKPVVSIALRPSRGIRAANVIRPGTRRMINASKGKNRILPRYGSQGGRNCHSIGSAMGLVDCNGNQDFDICKSPMSVHALCCHASPKLDVSSSSNTHIKGE